jgi:cytochrome c
MASSLEVNKMLAAILTAGIIASGTGVISRIIYHPHAPEENAYPIEVTETAGGAKPAEQEPAKPLAVLLASGSAEHGQTVAKACGACHNFGEGDPNKIGPHLYGVLGRDIASASDFSYSDALSKKEGKWDYEKLSEFLSGPRDWAPGTKMTFAGLKKPQDRADVILYLRSLSPNPEPLPEAPAAEAAPAGQEQAGQPVQEQAEAKPAETQPAEKQPAEQKQAEQKQAAAEQAPKEQAGGQPAGGGDFAQLLAAADPTEGERSAKICKACHTFEAGAPNKIGPALHNVVGRDIASAPGFSYSSALQSKDGTWDYDQLNQFLTSPKEFAPGTKMAFAGLKKPEQRAAVIAYLRSITDNPPPLPGSG